MIGRSLWTILAMAAVTVLAGCNGTGGAERLTAEVSLVDSSGCRIKAGGAELLDEIVAQQEPERIVIEAEQAQSFQWQEGIGVLRAGRTLDETGVVQIYAREDRTYEPQTGDDVGGGQYIDYTHQATYLFRCTSPGAYTIWGRHYFPRPAGWAYRLQIDDGEVMSIRMRSVTEDRPSRGGTFMPVPTQQWTWVNCGTVELAEGTHVLNMTNLHGGKRVDRYVFSKGDAAPEGIGPEATPRKPLELGYAVTEPVRLMGRAMPVALDYEGGAGLAVRQGDGPWTPVQRPAGQDVAVSLNDIAFDPKRPLQFKIDLKRGGGTSTVRDIALTMTAPGQSSIVLENDAIRLRFDRATGFPCGIVNKVTGQTVQPEGLLTLPFDMYLEDGPDGKGPYPRAPRPEGVTLSAADAQLDDLWRDGDAVYARYLLHNGEVRLTTKVALNPAGDLYTKQPLTRWTMGVENNSDLDILSIRYPIIQRVKIGGASTDDVLAWGRIGGEMITVPAQAGAWVLPYPGRASVAYLELFDNKGGFYFSSIDPDLYATDIEMTPRSDADRIDLSMQKRHRIRTGETYTWSFQAAPHAGDWHWGADRYREFFHRTFGKPDYPDWLKNGDGWIAASHMFQPFDTETYERELIDTFRGALYYGYDYVQNWATTFRGACPTYYLPLKEYGGAESFTAANRWWHDRGGKSGYYFHGNAISAAFCVSDVYWTIPWSEYPREVRAPDYEWFVRNRSYPSPDMEIDKSKYVALAEKGFGKAQETRRHGNVDLYERMTFAGPAFANHQTFWAVDKYNDEYMADVIYWDTFAWGGDTSEFNPFYGCYGDGDMTPPRRRFLEDVIRKARRTNPEYYQLTEGCVDIYGTHCYHMISGFTRNPEVFRYTLPEQIVFEGHQNGGWGSPRVCNGRIESAFLYGNKFDAYGHLLRNNHLLNVFWMRKWLTPWMNASEFMDRIGVRTTSPDVRAIAHRVDRDDAKGVIVTFHNPKELEGVQCTLSLDRYGVPARAFLFELGKEPATLDYRRETTGKTAEKVPVNVAGPLQAKTIARFAIPQGKVSAVLLIEKAEGAMAWHVGTHQKFTEGVACQAINYSGQPVTISIGGDANESVTLEGGVGRTAIVKPADPLTLGTGRKVNLTATVGDETRELFQGVLPAVDDIDFARRGRDVEGVDGKVLVLKRAGGKSVRERFGLRLTPGTTWRLRCRIKQDKGGAYLFVHTGDSPSRFWRKKWADEVNNKRDTIPVPNKAGEWVEVEGTFTVLGHGALEIGTGGRNTELMVTDLEVEEVGG
jgi:hypothetical protein